MFFELLSLVNLIFAFYCQLNAVSVNGKSCPEQVIPDVGLSVLKLSRYLLKFALPMFDKSLLKLCILNNLAKVFISAFCNQVEGVNNFFLTKYRCC